MAFREINDCIQKTKDAKRAKKAKISAREIPKRVAGKKRSVKTKFEQLPVRLP